MTEPRDLDQWEEWLAEQQAAPQPAAYENVRILGRGNFDVTHLVRNVDGKMCCHKQIPIDKVSSVRGNEAMTEVRILKLLGDHPYLVPYEGR